MNQQCPEQPGQQPPMPAGMYAPPPPRKLIASAFADRKTSKNSLVTIYDPKDEMFANGNF
ncbi:hypothetical protein ABZ851_32285 [Streptomyces sp. NPDC047049]|uniref:hypothetical protein n=1 Tax=Streptomyces sp. NPDC047049 TaxID=3156688 RepID=UPI0034006150